LPKRHMWGVFHIRYIGFFRRFAYAAHVGCFSYKLFRLFLTPHSFSVTIFTLGFRLFFILLQIKSNQLRGGFDFD
jgi:hypothetical protein